MSQPRISADGLFESWPCGCVICRSDEDDDCDDCGEGTEECRHRHCGQMGPQETHKLKEATP